MKKIILFFTLSFSLIMNSQCFECAKNLGDHNGDFANGLKKSIDGIYLLKNSGNFNLYAGLDKYDFNCNLVWSKKFDDFEMYIKDITFDNSGNIYVLYAWTISQNAGYGPYLNGGLMMNPGLNLYKFNTNGDLIWHRFLGYGNLYSNLNNIYINNDILYVVSSHYGTLNVDNQYFFNFPYADKSRPYICKIDLQSNILDVKSFGTSLELFTASEMDINGSIYLSSHTNSGILHSDLYKIDSNLQLEWSKEITNGSNYIITNLYYYNNKLYTWGAFNATVNVLGNVFLGTGFTSGIFQSLLGEFNIYDGNVERIIRIDNNSSLSIPGVNGNTEGNNAYMTSKGNEIFIFTSFSGTLVFPNETITSNIYYNDPVLYSEELVLFKVDLSNFATEFKLKSYGVSNLDYGVIDAAGPILFDNNDLYLTATFSSKPIQINGVTINNNSGNNASDVMYYKFNINSFSNIGTIDVQNTCYNEITEFSLNGNYDSILWDFGEPNSLNNSSSIVNPTHQYLSTGTYHVTATVTCGSQSQIVEKDIYITTLPTITPITPLFECEDISGSGISSSFDTSNISNVLIGNQQNITIRYVNSNGSILPSPLPNPYTNSNPLGDLITARVYNSNNPDCYIETSISFSTIPKPEIPTLTSPQSFCIQDNATINSIIITGQNIKWYDALTGGNLLSNATILTNGTTYYASQTINGCESVRVPVLASIQNTPAPSGDPNQLFCSSASPNLSSIVLAGTAINWYATNASLTVLPNTTTLIDGATYYATQTINGCESVNRFPVTVSLINTLNATNYSQSFCDDLNDGSENVLLSDYNQNLIGATTNITFTYYSSLSSAQNQVVTNQLNPSHNLTLGDNIIYVRLDSTNGCHQIVELTLKLISKPVITIPDNLPLCEKSTLTVNAGSGFSSYLWSTGATTPSITITQIGNYTVTVTQNHGTISCQTTKNFNVFLSNSPTIANIETEDWTDTENTIVVNVTSGSIGDYEYSIDGVNYQDSPIFSGLLSGQYTVYVNDKNDCGLDKEIIFLLVYPKFFTPNGDGNNDTWKIKFSQYEAGLKITIFDRYGKIISLLDNKKGWDGTYNGALLPSDDYWFVVTRANGKVHKGHFAMKR